MPKSKRLLVLVGLIAFAASPLVAQGPKDKAKDEAPKVAAPNTTPEIGNIVADYTFRNFISGDGRTSMKDFRGSVVLVDWWGTH
jgi:hypothetical protein